MRRKTSPRFKPSNKDLSPADAAVRKGGYELKGRVWIEGASGTFLGCGRVVLLERIADLPFYILIRFWNRNFVKQTHLDLLLILWLFAPSVPYLMILAEIDRLHQHYQLLTF